MRCPCGRVDDRTGGSIYSIVQYDKYGQDIVYAVCQHGVEVIDTRPEPPPWIDFDTMFEGLSNDL